MFGEVWVYAEQRQGKLLDVSLELLGKGIELAQSLGSDLASVLIGDGIENLAPELICYGADKVYVLEDSRAQLYEPNLYARLLSDLARSNEPEIILLGATALGGEISAAAGARLNTGVTAHCIDLYISKELRLIHVVPWLENKVMEIICRRNPQIATAKPGVFLMPTRDEKREGKVLRIPVEIDAEEPKVRTVEVNEEKPLGVLLEEADIVISGGWGLHSAGGFEPVKTLAGILGAAVGGTRPAVDKEWIPQDSMIGQSGKTVSPELFISIGASGAMHYTTGFSRSKVILAVDRNPEAPIFDMADVGIVGDLEDILPYLIEEFRQARKAA
ncbi:MAG: electron transfer flavoprotein subunit alpha/FixB family protein [Dehalococcoidia bacterium]|nr:MAG: electron transfer flavoprotein subunit alpha/FixB family protein [Dehalococcoidia bacterium]